MELNEKTINAGYSLMNMTTKGYYWYHDTPEQPFKYDEGSIWLINPDKKEWMFHLEKSGRLWYFYKTSDTFFRYMNMQNSDFELFIKMWVEDVLKNGVSTTQEERAQREFKVEDVLKNGVSTTNGVYVYDNTQVEDVLKNGVSTTDAGWGSGGGQVEDVLKNGVSTTYRQQLQRKSGVEDVLKNGKHL